MVVDRKNFFGYGYYINVWCLQKFKVVFIYKK